MTRIIRVLIAEDQETIREELRQLIDQQPDMEIVAVAEDGDEVLALARDLTPETVLLDLGVPGCGLRLLEQLAEMRGGPRVVVLALHEEIKLLRSVLAFGSLGYVVHKKDHEELLSAMRKIHGGRSYVEVPTGGLQLPPGLDPHSPRYQELQEKLDLLSKREREVLEAVAFGFTNREIAARIGVSVKSVETYRYRVAEKLAFKSRADLVRFSLEAGLLRTGKDAFASQES